MHGISPGTAALVGIPECGYPSAGLDHGAIALGDQFLHDTVEAITHSKAWQGDAAIAIVWDEDDYTGFSGCCGSPTGNGFTLGGSNAPALILTAHQNHGRVSFKAANHYTLLGTLQQVFGLGCLNNTCALKPSDLLTEAFGD